MGDAAHGDGLGPDATRAMPGYRRFGPEQIRFASNAAAGENDTGSTSGTARGSGARDWQAVAGQPGARGQREMPGPAARPDADRGPATGWFGRHPDLWVVGGGLIVATAAMVAAFAAASGAMAGGNSQPPWATTTPAARSVCVFAPPPLANPPVAKR